MAYTTIDDPTQHFEAITYTGNDSNNRNVTGLEFTPGFVWIKNRSTTDPHKMFDVARGANKSLKPNSVDTEVNTEENGYVSAFISGGFTLTDDNGSANLDDVNKNNEVYIAWCWKANGTSTASNNDGTNITSTVSANTTGGFAALTWTGTGTESDTVGHCLGAKTDAIWIKERTGEDWWHSWQTGMGGDAYNNFFNNNHAIRTGVNDGHVKNLNNTTTFGFESTTSNVNAVNHNSINNVAWVFAAKQGYSKMGNYRGNGSTNGPFVYLGFKPAWVYIKRTDAAGDHVIMDNKKNPNNVMNIYTKIQATDADNTDASFNIDKCATGFKCRYNNGNYNADGGDYLYMAFAEDPTVNSSGIPCNAG